MIFGQENCNIYSHAKESSDFDYNIDSNLYKIMSHQPSKSQFHLEVCSFQTHQFNPLSTDLCNAFYQETAVKKEEQPKLTLESPLSCASPSTKETINTHNAKSNVDSVDFSSHRSKTRKWGRDSFHKKIKCMFLKYVVCFFQTKLHLTFVQKLPQKLVTNVTKKFNRDLLMMNLEYFGVNCLGLSRQIFETQDYRSQEFKKTKVHELFDDYLGSVNYEMDVSRIRDKESDLYLKTLIGYINEFVRYYCPN